MAKFRKKPVVVEAEQWFPGKFVEGVMEPVFDSHNRTEPAGYGVIDTLESNQFKIMPGDWIITGVKGEKYGCKPDIFEATYEKVEETEEEHPLTMNFTAPFPSFR